MKKGDTGIRPLRMVKPVGGNPPDLVCFSHLQWDYVFQRPHHLMARFARQRRVFYVEEPRIDQGSARLVIQQQDETGVSVVIPYLPDGLSKEKSREVHIALVDELIETQQLSHFITWYYTPMAIDYTRHLKSLLSVYDCMDELSAFKSAPKDIRLKESELLERVAVVFTGGYSLYEARQNSHRNIHPFPSSIDVPHFGKARQDTPDPPDQTGISHPRLGFFGVIDERMDLDLVEGLAKARPAWSLVMIGPVAKVNPEKLPRQTNIHYLGNKTYQELPAYLSGWDVALMPFAQNEATRFISPTKTPEYLAGGKPVVSTPIPDVIRPYGKQGLVKIADGVEAFIHAVEECLEQTNRNTEWLHRVDAFLSRISWDNTWQQMNRVIEAELLSALTSTQASD